MFLLSLVLESYTGGIDVVDQYIWRCIGLHYNAFGFLLQLAEVESWMTLG